MERKVRCEQCRRTVTACDHQCDDCRRAWKVYGWRRFAAAMMRGIEPEEDRKTLH